MFHVKQSPAERLERYKELVRRYHATLDLTSAGALEAFDDKLDDALAYVRALMSVSPSDEPLLDLGSGVGLPAVPLAIRCPDRPIYLLERRRRRASFLRIVLAQLELESARVIDRDVRDVRMPKVSLVTAQAVASFADVYCLTRHLHAAEVTLLSRKGEGWQAEAEALSARLGVAVSPVYLAPLASRGTLVALRVAGGLACPS